MTKRPTINTLTNTASPTYLTQLNQNFTNVKNQFDNTLSLDGSLPNAMNADLDLNGNDLINGGTLSADKVVVGGIDLTTQVSNAAASATSAAASAATATAYTPAYFNNFTALKADTRTWPVGQLLNTRAEGFAYQVVTSGQHLTTTGGVKLIVLPSNSGYNVKAFGAVGNGTTDDTATIQAALNAASHVFMPEGAYLITSSITVPARKRLEFEGGWANLVGTPPLARLIKAASMTTTALIIETAAVVTGGGVIGLAGNTGDNVQLRANSAKLMDFFTSGAGRDGVRVGEDGVYTNCNSTVIERVWSRENGRHGFYVHQGVGGTGGASDTNQGTMLHCIGSINGGDGIKIGSAYWVTVINALTEGNQGYGLHLSGALSVVAASNYPECRRANIIGGDFFEGNVLGNIFDQSYFSLFMNADINQFPTNAGNAYQGSGRRACYGTGGATTFEGGTITTADGQREFSINDGSGAGSRSALTISRYTALNNGDGTSIRNRITTDGTNYVDASRIETIQVDVNKYALQFKVWNTSAEETFLSLNANAQAINAHKLVRPISDNLLDLGSPALRWRVVYAGTGAINTSDERLKQDISSLDEAEKRVAVRLKALVKKFRFKDAVLLKGDDARIHIGVIAQEVVAAFTAEGLDANRYGLLCHDSWPASEEILDADGNVIQAAVEADDRYGIRYEELLAFIIAAL